MGCFGETARGSAKCPRGTGIGPHAVFSARAARSRSCAGISWTNGLSPGSIQIVPIIPRIIRESFLIGALITRDRAPVTRFGSHSAYESSHESSHSRCELQIGEATVRNEIAAVSIGRGPPSGPISEAEFIRAPYKEDVLVVLWCYSGRFGVLVWTSLMP